MTRREAQGFQKQLHTGALSLSLSHSPGLPLGLFQELRGKDLRYGLG